MSLSTKQKKSPNYKKKWSDEDILVIRYGIRHFSVKNLSERLGRSESSIYWKLRDIGISITRERENLPKIKMKPSNSFWTDEKFQYVKEQALVRPISDISEEIGKSESTVQSKLKREGISVREVRGYIAKKPKPNAWSESEIAYLKRHAGSKTSIEMSKKLNRSRLAVKVKAARLGLSLEKNPWSEEQTEMLYRLHDEGYNTRQISKHIGRSIESVRTKMRSCLLDTNYIWSESDIDYLVEQKQKGVSFSEIGKKIGRTPQACSKKYHKTVKKTGISKESERG